MNSLAQGSGSIVTFRESFVVEVSRKKEREREREKRRERKREKEREKERKR